MLSIIFYEPVFNLLIVLYRSFGDNLALALISIALISRLITIPVTNKQIKSAEKSKEFQEKYNKLKKQYAKNKEKLTQEAAKLQAEYLPGQISGCLPMILQFVMFYYIYKVLRTLFASDGLTKFNEIAYSFVNKFADGAELNKHFLGNLIDLGKSPASVMPNLGDAWPYLVLIVLVVLAQYFSTQIMTATSGNKKADEDKKKDADKKKNKNPGKPEEPDMSEIMQSTSKQMMFILPLVIGFVSYNAPAGLTLYWTVQSAFVIIQRSITKREDIIKWVKTKFGKDSQPEANKTAKADK